MYPLYGTFRKSSGPCLIPEVVDYLKKAEAVC